jgi:hypothetical protein
MKTSLNSRTHSEPSPFRNKASLALAAMLLIPAASTFADSFWIGGTGTFNRFFWNYPGIFHWLV